MNTILVRRLLLPKSTLLLGLLFFGIYVSFFFNIGVPPLFDWDEGAFSEATREMLASNNWLSVTLNGDPRYDKPILTYWLQGLSAGLLNLSESSLRLPSAIAASIWVLLIYIFGRTFFSQSGGFYAAWMAVSSIGICLIGRAATADAILNLLITMSMYASLRYIRDKKIRWLYTAYVFVALGFLTKGPIAVLIPLATTLIYFVSLKDWRTWVRSISNPYALIIFSAIALPWYAFMFATRGWEFFDGFFLTHNINRFQGPMEGHGGSLVYYMPIFLIMVFPFMIPAVRVLFNYRTYWTDPVTRFLLIWFLFVIIFFSLSGTKLPHYILYGLPGMLLLMGRELESFVRYRWILIPASVVFLAFLFLPGLLEYLIPKIDNRVQGALWNEADLSFHWGYRAFLSVAGVGFLIFSLINFASQKSLALSAGLVMPFVLSAWLLPKAGEIMQKPIKEAGTLVAANGWIAVQQDLQSPSFSVYANQIVKDRKMMPGEVTLILYSNYDEQSNFDIVFESRGLALIRLRENN
ncbi:MAG: hypothetical protein CL398_05050 [Acidiferrobacteraceae bacterium]|nr:hypothetical protein [Acidiferrobacteraceae bacterium]